MRMKVANMSKWLLAGMMFYMAGCGGSASLTPVGTVVDLSTFTSTYIGLPDSVPLNFPNLTGLDPQGNTLSGSLTINPSKQTTVINNISCYSTVSEVVLTQNGVPLYDSISTKYFKVSNNSFYSMIHTSAHGDTTYVRTSQDSFTSGSVKVGDSGNLGIFEGSDGTRLTATWAINADYNGGSIFVISQTYSNPAMGMNSQEDNFYLDAKGIPTKFAFRINTSEGTYKLSGERN